MPTTYINHLFNMFAECVSVERCLSPCSPLRELGKNLLFTLERRRLNQKHTNIHRLQTLIITPLPLQGKTWQRKLALCLELHIGS